MNRAPAVVAAHFGDMCKTGHGSGATEGSFKMPNADLPKLDPSPAGFQALHEDQHRLGLLRLPYQEVGPEPG